MQRFVPGYFGKLPLAADYLSRHAGDDEALAFERWLQEGVRATWERFSFLGKLNQRELPSVRFVFWTKEPGAFLVGLLSQGHDRSGRRFPFAAFVQNRSPGLEASASAFPVALEPFFESIEGFARLNILTPPELYSAVEESAGRIPPDHDPTFIPRTTLELALVGDIEGNDAGGGIGVGRVQQGIEELLALWEQMAGSQGSRGVGVRLPLPDGSGPAKIAAVFWMEVIRKIWRSAPAPPVCFWTAGRVATAVRGWLDVYTRPPGELAYIHLLDPGLVSDLLVPLAGSEDPAAIGPPCKRRPISTTLVPGRGLCEVLDLLEGGTG